MFSNMNDIENDSIKGKKFIGVVVANNDPSHIERIKVSIPNLFVGDSTNFPWVAPNKIDKFPGSATFGAFGLVPPIGTQVYVEFQDGNPLYGHYEGYPVQTDERPAEALTNYLGRYGFKDPQGNVFFIDTTPGASPAVQFTSVLGFQITINADKTFNLTANADINLTTSAKVNINTGADVHVLGDVIADGISLKHHVHSGIQPGGSNTGGPV